jgi:hypothetical protein
MHDAITDDWGNAPHAHGLGHWVAAQFEVTLFETQTARVQRVNCVRAGKRKTPNVFLLSLFYFSVG